MKVKPCLLILVWLELTFIESKHNTLRVTWSNNVFSKTAFIKQPLNESEARKIYEKIEEECSEGKFLGKRYLKKNDPAVIIIYDINGFIAGIQSGIPKLKADNIKMYPFNATSTYQTDTIDGETFYLVTVYFINPKLICTSGRLNRSPPVLTDLYVQTGSKPTHDFIEIEKGYDKIKDDSSWIEGQCAHTIGKHFFKDIDKDMDCGNFFPIFPFFNKNEMTGFAFFSYGRYAYSDRLENPSRNTFKAYFETFPKCMKPAFVGGSVGGVTMLHVYFEFMPWHLEC